MTENAAEAKAEAPKVPAKPLDEFGKAAKARLVESINALNALRKRVKAASGDPQEVLDALRTDTSVDPEAAKITAAIEELDNKREALWNKRDEILKPHVEKAIAAGKEGLGNAEAEAADLLKTVNAGKKYIGDLYGEDNLADLPPVVGVRKSSSGGAGGARRIRGIDVYVDGTLATARDGKGEQKSNMAAAAKLLGVDTEDLRTAFFAAAGTDDSTKYPAEVTFTVTVNEGEGDAAKPVVKTIVAKRVKEDETRATETPAA